MFDRHHSRAFRTVSELVSARYRLWYRARDTALDAEMRLAGKHIVLGVTGGIAAYKTPELVRKLSAEGAAVTVVMTRASHKFVAATALQAVAGRRVRDDLWDADAEAAMGHIELARWADLVLVAPATAHFLARYANGFADDLLSTLCLATLARVAVAPAMNQRMWQHPATQRNVARLRADGIRICGPGSGPQACGEFGPGRMLEPDALCDEAVAALAGGLLDGCHVIVTAGPTREPLDPVRYISNHSSGKQGFAIAAAARDAGARVTLISGPVALPTPPGVERIDVMTAREMEAQANEHAADCDVFIGVAAVADYRPDCVATAKIKKQGTEGLALALVQNPDIIAGIAARGTVPLVIGFAAETGGSVADARAKLSRKQLDMIVLNDVADRRIGFNSDDNAVTLVTADAEEHLELASKGSIAARLIERVAALLTTCKRQHA
jgi:phosphopantothenoylcysteine decarboxylase/phosphopantothenate--cysteine ligase